MSQQFVLIKNGSVHKVVDGERAAAAISDGTVDAIHKVNDLNDVNKVTELYNGSAPSAGESIFPQNLDEFSAVFEKKVTKILGDAKVFSASAQEQIDKVVSSARENLTKLVEGAKLKIHEATKPKE